MTKPDNWPENYFSSADSFLHYARAAGFETSSHAIAAKGPNDEALSVDVAALVSPTDEHRVILTSGVHGVEGYLGAAVQLQLLRSISRTSLPSRTGLVLIHAANPWGYAHNRRTNELNIDMNRNFIDDTLPLQSHPVYAELNSIINAQKAPGFVSELSHWAAAAQMILKYRGVKALFGPIAQGQYDYPHGLFYGGQEVSESCSLLQSLVKNYSSNSARVSVLDVHSGLGAHAQATLIGNCHYSSNNTTKAWLENKLGQTIVPDSSNTNAYNAQGTFARWCQQALEHQKSIYLCIEIGTYQPLKVFSALRRENQAHHWCNVDSASFTNTKRVLRDVFSPQNTQWREQSTQAAVQLVEKIISLPDQHP